MVTYLVTYDLNNEDNGANRRALLISIREDFDDYAKLSESSYAISTTKTPSGVHKHLKRHLDENDHIYIIALSKPYSGRGPKNVNEWLAANLV